MRAPPRRVTVMAEEAEKRPPSKSKMLIDLMKLRSALTEGPPIVAIVDDDPAVCNSLKFSLELEGFSVRAYGSGAELLRAGGLDDCKCFVIDQRMPAMNGLELIATLRGRHVLAPAILLTSNPDASLRARAARTNAPIVEKPLLGNALLERIREACAQH
jgi:two-component system response regulator FixJ